MYNNIGVEVGKRCLVGIILVALMGYIYTTQFLVEDQYEVNGTVEKIFSVDKLLGEEFVASVKTEDGKIFTTKLSYKEYATLEEGSVVVLDILKRSNSHEYANIKEETALGGEIDS